ncbi:TetR/AcrR family transcriptional regulator [Kitasatospora kazusensis]|uniref:TetR/AcrR family transcriptional regulator n=1 Tax=Kitasatospora kazusensis TaxID=407974 RepID=A0ABN2YYC4_9ACTN
MTDSATDGRVQKGNETRRMIVARTVQIASIEGLSGLSLGRLATDLGVSKSGVFALFGSKEELQLATVRAAQAIYIQKVIEPALETPSGIARVYRLCECWLEYSRTRVFPGGCFFFAANSEFDAQPGRIRDELAKSSLAWERTVEGMLEIARAVGEINSDTDVAQVAFELISFMEAANAGSLLHDEPVAPYRRASRAILHRLRTVATDPTLLPSP